jgi:hypothetical protein
VAPLPSAALVAALLAGAALVVPACSSSPQGASPSDAGVDAEDAAPFVCPTNDVPKTCPSPAPSWSADVQPILAARCWSCHADGGVAVQDMDLGSYASVYGGRTTVLSQVYGCRMPPSGEPQLTPAERATVLGWFACGAPND